MAGIGGKREGAGRKRGVPNKLNADIKQMIVGALSDVGGRDYLAKRAIDTPAAFMTLVGKVLPMQITGEGGGPVWVITGVEREDESDPSDDDEASIKD
jgi:hypothetical protein